ncbi:hypothetical protein ABW20_dc0109038 [Dactylellina cionopaga]|nr:hypothetical protein ABW20_dc0109038 [Dactylellina cionopaga]
MMSLGLPMLTPRDTQSLWYTPSHTFGYTVPPKTSSAPVVPNPQHLNATTPYTHHQQHRAQRDATRTALAAYGPSALQQLAIDEDAVEKRKLNIARFGATWIKPPGMMKTLQGVIDEELERAEQMALEETTADDGGFGTQEVNMVGGEPVEVAEDGEEEGEEVEVGEEEEGEEVEVGEEGLMEEGEVDLDAEIPEADSTGWSDDEEEEEDEDEEDEEDEDEDLEEGDDVDLDAEIPEAEEVSIYEEEEDDEQEEEEDEEEGADEFSAIAETTQGSIDETEIGDGSPRARIVTPRHGQRRATPTSSARGVGPGHFQNLRRHHRMQAAGSSPLGRQVVTTPARNTRRSRGGPAADSSILFLSGDEMEVDD